MADWITAVVAAAAFLSGIVWAIWNVRERAFERRWKEMAKLLRESPAAAVLRAHGIEDHALVGKYTPEVVVVLMQHVMLGIMYHHSVAPWRWTRKRGSFEPDSYPYNLYTGKCFRELWPLLRNAIGRDGQTGYIARIEATFAQLDSTRSAP